MLIYINTHTYKYINIFTYLYLYICIYIVMYMYIYRRANVIYIYPKKLQFAAYGQFVFVLSKTAFKSYYIII